MAGESSHDGEQPIDANAMLRTADDGAARLRAASSTSEGIWILAYAAVFTVALLATIHQYRWWENAFGIGLLVAVQVAAGITSWRRSANRTIRPKHFSAAWRGSMMWAASGMVVSLFVLNAASTQPSWWASAAAALVCTTPVFGCGIWLLVRAR